MASLGLNFTATQEWDEMYREAGEIPSPLDSSFIADWSFRHEARVAEPQSLCDRALKAKLSPTAPQAPFVEEVDEALEKAFSHKK